MSIYSIASPALKVAFERMGKPQVFDRPDVLAAGGAGAVVVCNHVGWADSLWLAYSLYPRQLRFMSKQELFDTRLSRWFLEQGGCIAIDRTDPAPSSIKTAVGLLRQGEVVLIFPSGTRQSKDASYKRGAATIALHAQVPIVPAFYAGPARMQIGHLVGRPDVQVRYGSIIATAGLAAHRSVASDLTRALQQAIQQLAPAVTGPVPAGVPMCRPGSRQ